MSYFHQIWERPQEPVLQKGHEQMLTAQKLGAKTDREKDYIAALATFYDNPTSTEYMKRVTAYSDAMGKLYAKYPKDEEAGAFYALSLLASEPPDDTSLANPKKAVAMLMPLFQRNAGPSPGWRTTSFTPATTLRWPRPRYPLPVRMPDIASSLGTRYTCRRTSSPAWDCGRKTSTRI